MPTAAQSRQKAKDERLQAHKVSDTQYRVYNPTSQSAYDVFKGVTGVWYCTCPFATKGSHIRPGICKHLQRVTDKETGCLSCHNKDARLNSDRKCPACVVLDKLESSVLA